MANQSGNSLKKNIVSAFFHELIKVRKSERCLKVSISDSSVFELNSSFQEAVGTSWYEQIEIGEKFDFILGDIPLGSQEKKEYQFGRQFIKATKSNWIEIFKILEILDNTGCALCIVEPNFFMSPKSQNFEEILNAESFFINAVFNTPEGICHPQSSIQPIILLIQREARELVFVGELLDEWQSKEIARNFQDCTNTSDISTGSLMRREDLSSFGGMKTIHQIEGLKTQYKNYKQAELKDFTQKISSVTRKEIHQEQENSIYIPRHLSLEIATTTSSIEPEHHHFYYQVSLDRSVINEYVAAFFETEIGRLSLKKLSVGVSGQIRRELLERVLVALPPLELQEKIVEAHRKLDNIKEEVKKLSNELAVNPENSLLISSSLSNMKLGEITRLGEADEVRKLARLGESKKLEYKSTLRFDLSTNKKNKELEKAVLKTIAAFLNTEGGVLLIGVSDDGSISGIDVEINEFHNENSDSFLRHFKDIVKQNIGESFYPYIDYNLINVGQARILRVDCQASDIECYLLRTEEFYVRTNPATDKLEGRRLVDYIRARFSSF